MNRSLKSMCYAFRAQDLEIFTSEDDDCFIASHLICSKCNAFWYTDLAECYLCGEINYNLQVCADEHYSSQQGSAKKCPEVIGTKQVTIKSGKTKEKKIKCEKISEKKCINKKCWSNTNKYIKDIMDKKRDPGERGVFQRTKSSFRTSQLHCIKCGNAENIYKHFRVYLVDYDEKTVPTHISNRAEDDLVIFKKRLQIIKGTPESQYASFEGSQNLKNWQPKWSELPDIINEVFS